MFKNDYHTAMDNIKADSNVKSQIYARLEAHENIKERTKNPAVPWRVGFALAACAALILSIIFVPKNSVSTVPAPKTLSAADSYSEIFNVLNEQKKQNNFNNFLGNWAKDEEIIYEYEYGFDDTEGSPATDIATGATGKPSQNNTNSATKGETNKDESESSQDDFSETTQQVDGVKEADIVKTDGKYIYCIYGNRLAIFKADGKNTALVNLTTLSTDSAATYGEMFVNGDRLVLMQPEWYYEDELYTSLLIYDISTPENIKLLYTLRQEGYYNSSRMIGDYVYMVSSSNVNVYDMARTKPETFVPTTICGEEKPQAVAADSIYRYAGEVESRYTVICAYNTVNGEITSTCSLLGGTDQIYCSEGNIITANTDYSIEEPKDEATFATVNTNISRLAISDGKIEYIASGVIPGYLEDQFYIDEHEGNFRFVTTTEYCTKSKVFYANSKEEAVTRNYETCATLTILDGSLKKLGSIDNLAKGEKVYSVRFMGDTAYFVTFRQTDPLFSADLSDPKNPKILGELKIPGFSEYLYPYGEGKLLGFGRDADEKTGATRDLKLSMFDITNPANVTESDVTIVTGYNYSPALYSHKAMLVSPTKNLMGFAVEKSISSFSYIIYEYTGNSFARVAQLEVPFKSKEYYYEAIRGMFIGDNFYIVSPNAVQCFEMESFTQTAIVEF